MSKTRKYHKDTIAVITRFITVLELMHENKKLNIPDYFEDAGINPISYYKQKAGPTTKGYFEIAWVISLITNYNVSPEWILLGKGEMFNKKIKEKAKAINLN